jgi:excinuclease ABC subunit C
MIREVVKRRYGRMLSEGKEFSDLLLIDGGLGHVQAAKEELVKMGIELPLVGLAKRNEEVWMPYAVKPLSIARTNQGLQLLQRIRDEAHRFARKYHILLRKKNLVESRK